MNDSSRSAFAMGLVVTLLLGVGVAHANPRPLPFTYQSETLPTGAVEVEQFVDFVPLRPTNVAGADVRVLGTQFQTEFEVGITDKLELGLYVTYAPPVGDGMEPPKLPDGNGAKQRLRYRLADPQAWPVDVALYGEVSENDREIELEAKVILQRRFGALRVITNLWAEHEFYFNGSHEWVLAPTLGATIELSPRFHLGAEAWMRAEFPTAAPASRDFNRGPHVFAGPAFLATFGKLWWSTGIYVRATDFDRSTQPTDAYGHLWARTIIGLGF
jgi:hypothetical protein